LLLEHNGRDKNAQDALGPLGETSQQSGPIIEQPLETLYRGIHEELGIEQPAELGLWMYERGGWVVNQWPRGDSYPGEFSCAIAFPVFITDDAKQRLLAVQHGTPEISRFSFRSVDEIRGMHQEALRPGVSDWLEQLASAGLLDVTAFGSIAEIDF